MCDVRCLDQVCGRRAASAGEGVAGFHSTVHLSCEVDRTVLVNAFEEEQGDFRRTAEEEERVRAL